MKTYPSKYRSQQRTGAVVPLMAFVISVLLIVLAIAINTNWMMLTQSTEQSAADLASVSALNHFSRGLSNPNNITDSRNLGEEILRLNRGGTDQGDRIKFGNLSDLTSHDPVFTEDESDIEAVQVELDNTNKIPLFMGGFVGRDEVAISAESVSVFQAVEVVLAIDASRSMNKTSIGNVLPLGASSIHEPPVQGSKWFELVDAIDEFLLAVEEVNPTARIGLVTFGGGGPHGVASPLDETESRLELPLQSIRYSNQILEVVDSYKDLPALGLGTFISDAIDTSLDELLHGGPVRAKRFIILLTDGNQYTFGQLEPTPGVAAERALANDIEIHTINFREVANPKLLEAATVSGGQSFDAGDSDELRAAFQELVQQFKLRLAN